MKRKRRNKNKWIWWGTGLILVVIIGVVIGAIVMQGNSGSREDIENSEEDTSITEKEKNNDEKQDNEEDSVETQVEKPKVVQYEGEDPNKAEELSGTVTYADVANGTLMIRTSIDQYLTDGTCELTLKREGAIIYSDKANIVGDVSTATCQGFDVTTAGLGGGKIEINININANGKNGTIRGEASI